MKEKICKICKKKFKTKYSNKVNCSPDCSKKWKLKQDSIYRDKNREELRKQQKEYYQDNKEKVLEKNSLWKEKNREEYKKSKVKAHKTYMSNPKFREKKNKYDTNWKRLHPNIKKANAYAYQHQQRGDKCEICGVNKEEIGNLKLHFHHTNYEKKEGFTVCINCHNKIHIQNK